MLTCMKLVKQLNILSYALFNIYKWLIVIYNRAENLDIINKLVLKKYCFIYFLMFLLFVVI